MGQKKESRLQCSYLQALHLLLVVLIPLIIPLEVFSPFSSLLLCKLSVSCLVFLALMQKWSVESILSTCYFDGFTLFDRLSEGKMFQDLYGKAEKLLSSALNDWGLTLAASDTLDPAWAQILGDPFLRRILLRYPSSYLYIFLFNFQRI